ncbi:MAG: hypothetical protein R3C53_25270 [Pirellulaceae bacterium]
MNKSKRRSGLILLVVLGMLSLFSMLAITYVVFSSQSRSSSLTMARKSFRGTPPSRLMDEAAHQMLRGSNDRLSALWRQGLLGDFYGSNTLSNADANDGWISVFPRTDVRDNPARQVRVNWLIPAPVNPASLEGPRLLSGSFLKIPLQWNQALPQQHDVFNGRIVTFLAGPLENKSFRIIRYLGEMDSAPAPPNTPPPNLVYEQSLQYSITIDLTPALNELVTVGTTTAPLQTWLTSSTDGSALCYGVRNANAYDSPFAMHINAAPLNALGSGVGLAGDYFGGTAPVNQTTDAAPFISFLTNVQFPPATATEPYRNIATVLLQNYSAAARQNSSYFPTGDLDEPHDAADVSDFHLSYRFPGATDGNLIIPALHRPAVINYVYSQIVDVKSLPNFTLLDLFSTIELLQRACGRPLSFRILDTANPPNVLAQQNPSFTGSNYGDFPGNVPQTPQLSIVYSPQNWSGATLEHQKIEAWVRWLQRGPWDVDTDGDAIADANWTDINLPLMTSEDGRLLKVLAAYYVEDLSGRLNLNASGSYEQALNAFNSITGDNRYVGLNGGQMAQGLGYGTADISLRHLFGSDAEYERFMAERNGAVYSTATTAFLNYGPGLDSNTDDAVSVLRQRNRRANHNQNLMPGLPMSVFGRSGIGFDLFGNPISFDLLGNQLNQNVDDPYESRVLSTSRSDRLITIQEWERVQRMFDPDRSTLPDRLERLMLSGQTYAVGQDRIRAVTPRSSSTIAATFPGSYLRNQIDPNSPAPPNPPNIQQITRRVTSFTEMVEAVAQQRFGTGTLPVFDNTALVQLFPIEFKHNLPFDLNRPFGNGADDSLNGNGLIDEASESAGHGIDDDGDGLVDEADEIANFPLRHQRAFYSGGNSPNIIEDYGISGGTFDPFYEDTANRTVYERRVFGGNQGRQLLARHLYCLAQLLLPNDYVFPNQPNATAYPYGSPERARILAQWAVNVVDFRDMDANNTRFAYDDNPLQQKPGGYWVPNSGVVWGREQAELLVTESLAFHDMRISRKQNPPPGTNQWQQLRVPQGSLFLEFVATASSDTGSGLLPGVPRGTNNSLYRVNNQGRAELVLSGITPPDNNNNRFPVWRVLLLDPHQPGSSVEDAYLTAAKRATMQYQFASAAGLAWDTDPNNPLPTPGVNRVLWFADLVPTAGNLALPGVANMLPEKVYRNQGGGGVFLAGGQYLTVGPRVDTFLGQRDTGASPPLNNPSRHRIQMQVGWTQIWTEENNPGLWQTTPPPAPLPNGEPLPTPAQFIAPSVSLVAQADPPAGWTLNTDFVGLNISEPTPDAYYPDPTLVLNSSDNGTDPITGVDGFDNLPPDAYVDLDANPNSNSPHDPLDLTTGPLAAPNWQSTGGQDDRPRIESRANWSTAVLQRLANPDLPWHDTLNPYITIDWLPIDLTVFSGEYSIPEDGNVHLASRQKTGLGAAPNQDLGSVNAATLDSSAGRTLFSYHSVQGPRTSPLASMVSEPGYFDYVLPLEYEDVPNAADTPLPRITAGQNVGDFVTLGYLNSRYGLRGMNGENTHANYLNSIVYYNSGTATAPSAPVTVNRDFVSSYELMNVPLSSPGQIMQEFTPTPMGNAPPAHLLDYDMLVGSNATVGPKQAVTLLELTGTKNPWQDSDTILNPSFVVAPTPTSNNDHILNNALAIFRPPFNRLANYVEPGVVNPNTASEDEVLRGLMWSAITPAANRNSGAIPYQNELSNSLLQSSPSASLPDPNPTLNKNVPTRFPGIFKSAFASSVSLDPSQAGNPPLTGLLRPVVSSPLRVFAADASAPFNPLATNYPVTRLKNLTASNSNVYAVRVVLGYFEFDPATGLGREYGEDEGKVKRHKGFYIMDRSIPAAYREGEDLNTDNCILLRRIIE